MLGVLADSYNPPVVGGGTTVPPVYSGLTGAAAAVTPVTLSMPAAAQIGDILCAIFFGTYTSLTIATDGGGTWTEKTTGLADMSLFWSRYNGSQGSIITNDPSDFAYGIIVGFRGCLGTGDPIDVIGSGSDSSGNDVQIIPGVTTTIDNTLVVVAIRDTLDLGNPRYSAWANANLIECVERFDNGTTLSFGGGLGVATGAKLTAGATGNTTVTQVSTILANSFFTFALKPAATLPAWTPYILGGAVQAWFDASDTSTITDAGGGLVSMWNDKSIGVHHMPQATAGNQPSTGTRTMNGLNTIDFAGGTQTLGNATWTVNQPMTIATVAQLDSVANLFTRIFGRGTATTFNQGKHSFNSANVQTSNTAAIYGGAFWDTAAPHLLVGIYNSTSSFLRWDGVINYAGNTSTTALTNQPIIGALSGPSAGWDGAISEIVVVDRALSGTDLTNLETYLATKWGVTIPTPITDPTQITGMQVWFDASNAASITSSGGTVSQWNDLSGNGRHATQATGSLQPVTGVTTVNGKNILTFDGVDDYLNGATTQLVNATTGEWTYFCVVRLTTSSGTRVPFAQDGIAAGTRLAQFFYTNSSNTSGQVFNTAGSSILDSCTQYAISPLVNVISVVRSPTDMELFVNGFSNGPSVTAGTPTAYTIPFRVGAGWATASTAGLFWPGDIAEIIIYNTTLTAFQRASIEVYLRNKWGF